MKKINFKVQTSKFNWMYRIFLHSIFVLFGLFFTHATGHAAELYFGATGKEVMVGNLFEVGVFIDTQGERLNAFEGEIQIPTDMVVLAQVRDSNSIVGAWIQKPAVTSENQQIISFSGIVPGGYKGTRGLLFSLILQSTKPGEIRVQSVREQVLRDDGLGTPVKLTRSPITIIGTTASTTEPVYLPPFDPDQPETFTPTLGHDPNLFNGRYFVAFTAQDKGSGISHYEIAEVRYSLWHKFFPTEPQFARVESPYQLTDQKLKSTIYVKAVDYSNNERIVVLSPTNMPWYEKYLVWCILGVVILLVLGIAHRLYGANKKTQSDHNV